MSAVPPEPQRTSKTPTEPASDHADGKALPGPASADFGSNEWLVDELYQRYLADPGSVDMAWWNFFADYTPPAGAAGPATDATNAAPASPPGPARARESGGATLTPPAAPDRPAASPQGGPATPAPAPRPAPSASPAPTASPATAASPAPAASPA